ncbi:rCG55607, partial [Rattus norvegicus]
MQTGITLEELGVPHLYPKEASRRLLRFSLLPDSDSSGADTSLEEAEWPSCNLTREASGDTGKHQ